MMELDPAQKSALETRQCLLRASSGALATLSREEGLEGYPFGSMVPFALTESFAPILMLSGLAQHTKNLQENPRASLLIQAPEGQGDPQADWRVTLVGDLELVEVPLIWKEELRARYLARVPGADRYLSLPDFQPWVLSVKRVRFIGGFGKIRWVEAAALEDLPGARELEEAAPGILEHMNQDHSQTLRDLCQGLKGVDAKAARITSIDCTGFLVRCQDPDQLLHFSFGREIGAEEVRETLIGMVKEARQSLDRRAVSRLRTSSAAASSDPASSKES